MRVESKSALAAMQKLETRSDEELEAETRYRAAAQALLGARAAERMDAKRSREHFRAAIAAARPQERLQLRRMAEASLALAERRAGDLKVAAEKLGQTPPSNRQLLLLRFMGLIAPPPGSNPLLRARGILIVILLIVAALALGWGLVQLVALPFGGLDAGDLDLLGLPAGAGRARGDVLHRTAPAGRPRAPRRPSSAPTRWAPAVRRAAPAVAAAGARSRAAPGARNPPHGSGAGRVGGGVTANAPALPPFWSLVEAHGDELLAHARRVAGPEHAEDVLQDAFLRALRAYPRLRHAEHLRAWLYRITTTAAIDAHRARPRERPVAEPPEVGVTDDVDADGAFEALIAPLPEASREPLRLRFVEDLDYDHIAGRLGCSPQAARQRVSTAVRTLRERHAA